MKRLLKAPLALALSLLAGMPAHADAITDWNQAADGFITEAKLGTPPAVRVMALLQDIYCPRDPGAQSRPLCND